MLEGILVIKKDGNVAKFKRKVTEAIENTNDEVDEVKDLVND